MGLWLESVQAPGLPEASQRSPIWRRDCLSSGVLEVECECGGARGQRGGNPGLQRELGPGPPTPPALGGAGAAGGIQELGRGRWEGVGLKDLFWQAKSLEHPGFPGGLPSKILTRPDPA